MRVEASAFLLQHVWGQALASVEGNLVVGPSVAPATEQMCHGRQTQPVQRGRIGLDTPSAWPIYFGLYPEPTLIGGITQSHLLLMLVPRIERAATTYHEARADLQREAGEDDSTRGALDQVIEEVRELLRSGRELTLRLGDESIAQRAGLIGRLPDGWDALLERARSVRKQLKDSPWKLDGVFGTSLSSKAIRAQLDPLAAHCRT